MNQTFRIYFCTTSSLSAVTKYKNKNNYSPLSDQNLNIFLKDTACVFLINLLYTFINLKNKHIEPLFIPCSSIYILACICWITISFKALISQHSLWFQNILHCLSCLSPWNYPYLNLRFVLHFGTLIIFCRRYLKYTRTIICILTSRLALKYTTFNLILRVITLWSFRPLPNSKNFVILEVVAEKSISQDDLTLRFNTKTTWFNPSRFSNRKLYISLIIMHKLPCIFALVISFFLSIVLLSLNVF